MKKLLVVLMLGGALAACSEQPTAPEPGAPLFSATSEREVFVDQFDFWAYNACLAEDMHLYVVLQARLQTVTTSKETRVNMHWRFLDGTRLEGSNQDDLWLLVPGDHGVQVGTISGDFLTVREHLVFNNPVTGTVLAWPSKITFVANANGEVKVDRFSYLEDCTLRH